MDSLYYFICLVVLVLQSVTVIRGDTTVSCVFLELCLLPCTFPPASEEVIHWMLLGSGEPVVHSYYRGQDHLTYQEKEFSDRTSLFHDQISKGNASLRLSGVSFKDQRRYKCYTSTVSGNQESFIGLTIEAPVVKVDIKLVNDTITCSSRGIYPAPELSWSTSPPSQLNLQNRTTLRKYDPGLHDISSFLNISNHQLAYFCSVSTNARTRIATVTQYSTITATAGTEVTILCNPTAISSSFDLTWTFNHGETVLRSLAGRHLEFQEAWKTAVQGVSATGSLQLRASSVKYEGTYICELSNAEVTRVSNTFLKIEASGAETRIQKWERDHWLIALVMAVLAVALVGIGVYVIVKRKTKWTLRNPQEPTASSPLAE